MDKVIKTSNNELGTITATLTAGEVASLHLSPVAAQAPGIIVLEPGTAKEEHIYYATRDAGAGIVSGLVRDITNLHGGAGVEHTNGAAWETMITAEYWNGFVDLWLAEHTQSGIHRGPVAVAYTPAPGATVTLDLSVANRHKIQMPAGNITVAISNGTPGQIFMIEFTQDGVGSRSVTWFTTIKWADGVVPVLSGANKRDRIGFIITGANTYDGDLISPNI
jgi:hypothetical protein